MAFKILPIFGSKNEVKILELIKKHLSLIREANVEFLKVADAAFKKKFDLVLSGAKTIDDIEKQADLIKKEVEKELYGGAFLPATRSNLYTIIEREDQVCNQIQNVANMFIYLKKRKPNNEISEIFKKLVQEASSSINSLDKIAGSLLLENKKDISKEMEEMKRVEKNADLIQRRLFDELLLSNKKMDPISVDFFGNLGHSLSEICDEVKHTCDFVALVFILKQA